MNTEKSNKTSILTNFDSWVSTYGDTLFEWAFYKVSNKEIAEDLVQETFLAAFKGLKRFKENSSPKTWLFSILNNKIIDYYRKKANTEITLDTNQNRDMLAITDSFFNENGDWSTAGKTAIWENNDQLLDNEDFIRTMSICMDDLPENWRKAISFKYILEKNSKEICQELNISMTNYWQVIHRAKLLLRKCLEINHFNKTT